MIQKPIRESERHSVSPARVFGLAILAATHLGDPCVHRLFDPDVCPAGITHRRLERALGVAAPVVRSLEVALLSPRPMWGINFPKSAG